MYMVNNTGTNEFGYLEGFCSQAKDLLHTEKLAGERCDNDDECYNGRCYGGRCNGLASGEACSDTKQCSARLYCNGGSCADTVAVGNVCTADDDCSIDCICAAGSNRCQYVFYQNENTTVRDSRQWKSAVKRNINGNNGNWMTTDSTRQNGVTLINNEWAPDSNNLCQLRSETGILYPTNIFNDFTQLAFTISGPNECQCLYNTTGKHQILAIKPLSHVDSQYYRRTKSLNQWYLKSWIWLRNYLWINW